jgi:hypothetical protein
MIHHLLIIITSLIYLPMTDRINQIIQMMEVVCHLMRDIEIISFNLEHSILLANI